MTNQTMLSVISNYFSPLNTTLKTYVGSTKSNWHGRVVALLVITGIASAYAIFRLFTSHATSAKTAAAETPLSPSGVVSRQAEPSPIPVTPLSVTPPRPANPTPESPQQSATDSTTSTSSEEQQPTPTVDESPDEEEVVQSEEESENETTEGTDDELVRIAKESPENTPEKEVKKEVDPSSEADEADDEESDSEGLTNDEQKEIQDAMEQRETASLDEEDEDTSLTPAASYMQPTPFVAALGEFSSLALRAETRKKLQNQVVKTVINGLAASPRREPVKSTVNSPETDFRKVLKGTKTN